MQGVIEGVPIILVLVAGIGAPLAGWYATRRYRNPGTWFVLGALTGPIALALLALSPPGRCPECDARVDGWAAYCDRCVEPLPARIAFASSRSFRERRSLTTAGSTSGVGVGTAVATA